MASVIENMTRAKDDLLAIKDAVIATGVEVPNGTPSSLFADKVAEVYEKGKSESSGGGDTDAAYNEGYEQGKADEYERLFNAIVDGSEPTGDIVIEAETIKASCLSGCKNITSVEMTKVKDIGNMAFYICQSITYVVIPETCETIGTNVFGYNSNLATVTFKGTPTSIGSNCFAGCNKLLDIYVPWSEGEAAGAPWGATKATVHYNTTTE